MKRVNLFHMYRFYLFFISVRVHDRLGYRVQARSHESGRSEADGQTRCRDVGQPSGEIYREVGQSGASTFFSFKKGGRPAEVSLGGEGGQESESDSPQLPLSVPQDSRPLPGFSSGLSVYREIRGVTVETKKGRQRQHMLGFRGTELLLPGGMEIDESQNSIDSDEDPTMDGEFS